MTTLLEYAEYLAKPVEVLVLDKEQRVVADIQAALSVYNCRVHTIPGSCCLSKCLQAQQPELVFLGDDVAGPLDSMASLDLIEKICPAASVVILTRTPGSEKVAVMMKHGPYTFLVKNGSFNRTHVQRVFGQLNLKLREAGTPQLKNESVAA